MTNTYRKYCPNVFVAQCTEEHAKGDEITLTTKYGKENEHIVWNSLGKTRDGFFCYSITRSDGFDSRERARLKAERLEGCASNAEKRSGEAFRKADMSEDATGIPFGQPILVGHHSEARHRRTIERANDAMRKSVEESDKAERYERRAEYWANRADEINLSMPESLEYYAHKLEEAERHHADLKSNPGKRSHGMSLQYANKAKKDAEINLKLAQKLWGEGEPEPEPAKDEPKKNPLDDFEGMFFAFNNEQFAEGMSKVGLEKDDVSKIVSIGAGGYVLKDRVSALKEALKAS